MPLPKPHKGQSRNDWMNVCMSNKIIQKEWSDQDQKIAICENLWRHKSAEASYIIDTEADQYLYYTITPEDEGKNPLDHKSDNQSDDFAKTPDKWPDKAPNALDDIGPKTEVKPDNQKNQIPQDPPTEASKIWKDSDYKNSDQSNPPKSFPPLGGGGLNPNPDNSYNFPTRDNPTKPELKDMTWFLAEHEEGKDLTNYLEEIPMPEKMKRWYINAIDKDYESSAEWPLPFKEIEKDFDRPDKETTPETELNTKQSKENRDVDKIDKKEQPYSLYFKVS